MKKHTARRGRIAIAGTLVALAAAGSAEAFQALPPGGQVNDDSAAGINKALGVSGDGPGNADVVGGALTAGKTAVPWAVFRHHEAEGSNDQIFVRSFAGGAWTTRGSGTVGGKASANPQFTGSLNFDEKQDGEAPSIDFTGPGRTVPWATWYEDTQGASFGAENIFASRFDNTGDANQGKWIFGGQARGLVGPAPGVQVPSLNIHTNEDAENPSIAGGSAADPTKPGPWVTWQEKDNAPVAGTDQIFVSRPEGPGLANCDGVTPQGVLVGGHVPSVGGFCFQQTGIGRAGTGQADPSLNVDPTRNGVQPDIAFTGKNTAGVQDGVPWVVWYEEDDTNPGLSGLSHNNDMVFAAKGIADSAAQGGFDWTVVGSQKSGLLDASGTNHFGACAANDAAEEQCSLNKNVNAGAENPRVAAGTMNPANPTTPWVTWDEDLNGVKQIFVSRLVGGTHFELANNGAPISVGSNDSTQPDITFSGNTPYVSWREDIGGGVEKGFYGHFVNAANPTFVLDESDVPLASDAQANVREPISSGCTANPFNNDGAACQNGAAGTPFFLFTNGESPLGLFADAYQPENPVTGAASGISTSAATLNGSVNPNGAPINVSFQFGTDTNYGQSTAVQKLAPANAATPYTAALSGLPAGTTIHYRAVATSDFGTFVGADQTLTTTAATPGSGTVTVGHPKISGTTASVKVSCGGAPGAQCKLALSLTVHETLKGHKVVAVSARAHRKHKVVVIGTKTLTLTAGNSQTVRISLNRQGRKLLKARHTLKATLHISEAIGGGRTESVATKTVKFKARGHRHGGR
jgi:hypothetical protein